MGLNEFGLLRLFSFCTLTINANAERRVREVPHEAPVFDSTLFALLCAPVLDRKYRELYEP